MGLLQRLHHALLAARETRGLGAAARSLVQMAETGLGEAQDLRRDRRARGRQDQLAGP
jgi:hypothetical protein